MRFTFDADGDGAAEQFLASSFNADKLNCEWTVYRNFTTSPLDKTTNLRPSGFWWNPVSHEVLNYFRLGAEGGVAIFSEIEGGKVMSREQQVSLDEIKVGFARETAPRQGFQRIKPSVKVCLLADVVSGDDTVWRELIIEDGKDNYDLPNGRLLLKEDTSRIEALKSFTPNAALKALQKSNPPTEQSPNKSPRTSSLPVVQPSAPKKAPEAKPTSQTTSEELPSSTPWSIIAVMTVVVLGLLCLLVKNQK